MEAVFKLAPDIPQRDYSMVHLVTAHTHKKTYTHKHAEAHRSTHILLSTHECTHTHTPSPSFKLLVQLMFECVYGFYTVLTSWVLICYIDHL